MAFESTANRFVTFTASFDANVVVFDAQVAEFDEYVATGQRAFELMYARLEVCDAIVSAGDAVLDA